ncbi:MAG TPA: aspartate carbamoyltransferase, partial [Terriglobia bacterium]|nr:aspartate carbamoyltransferase [Terriglobia bacterium]
PLLKMKRDILDHLRERGLAYEEESNLNAVLPLVNVVYQTRVQKERFDHASDYEKCRGLYVIDRASLDLMQRDAILMHPLPRIDEITMEVDQDPRAAYFRQAQNGLYVRMALLKMVLGPGSCAST